MQGSKVQSVKLLKYGKKEDDEITVFIKQEKNKLQRE